MADSDNKPRWRVKWMDRNMEPPYPCGWVEDVVIADSRKDAVDWVRANRPVSNNYKVTCSKVK